jgi:hypothetical protein
MVELPATRCCHFSAAKRRAVPDAVRLFPTRAKSVPRRSLILTVYSNFPKSLDITFVPSDDKTLRSIENFRGSLMQNLTGCRLLKTGRNFQIFC